MKKRLLSILLCLCMVMTLLPVSAFATGSTVTPADNTGDALAAAFALARAGDIVQLTDDITTGPELGMPITVDKAVTLDFNGHTVTRSNAGTDLSHSSCMFIVGSGGSLTLRGSGGVTLSGNNSTMAQIEAGGTITVAGGTYLNNAVNGGGLITGSAGTINISGGTLTSSSYYAVVLSDGTINISGGEISSTESFALVPISSHVTMTGGKLTTGTSQTAYLASDSHIDMSGGTIENTGSGVVLNLEGGAAVSTISGGTITGNSGYGVFAGNPLAVSGSAVISSASNAGVCSRIQLTVNGGEIKSTSGIALANVGNLTMTDGTLTSDSVALMHMGGEGTTATVSGGAFTSKSSFPAMNYGAGELNISGGTFTTTGGSCAVYNSAGGTVNVSGGAFSGGSATLINGGAGTVKFSAGTIPSIVNLAAGKIVIDGGSVRSVQGATPENSAGTALRQYPIQLTGKASTPISNGELTFTPSASYDFTKTYTVTVTRS